VLARQCGKAKSARHQTTLLAQQLLAAAIGLVIETQRRAIETEQLEARLLSGRGVSQNQCANSLIVGWQYRAGWDRDAPRCLSSKSMEGCPALCDARAPRAYIGNGFPMRQSRHLKQEPSRRPKQLGENVSFGGLCLCGGRTKPAFRRTSTVLTSPWCRLTSRSDVNWLAERSQ
jgi:hypothetical protein